MDNTVPLRDQLVSLEGLLHWEERGDGGNDVEGGSTLCFVQDLGFESWRCGGINMELGIHGWTQWWPRLWQWMQVLFQTT